MNFERGYLLWLLLVAPPVLVLFFWQAERTRQRLLIQFVEKRHLEKLTAGISPARKKWRYTLVILAVALLIFSMAGLQHGYDLEEVHQRGLDIVVAIDTSKSMLTTDIAPNRLVRAKLAALELMQHAGADRLGLVAFAGDAFLECPLTVDNTAFQQGVQALNVNSIPEGGTALAEAIDTALTAFKEKDHYRALVLLTDGEDNSSEPGALAAAQAAAKEGLKIFTVGIGTAAGDLIRVTDANGNSDYVRDEQGNVVKSHLNESLLQQIARISGGFYLPLRGADTMDVLYDRGLGVLPKSEGTEKLIRRYHQQYRWPLAAAILLLLAEILLPERRRDRSSSPSPETGAAKMTVLIAGFCLLSNIASASPAGALRAYNAGNYTNALQEFTRLAEVRTNDLRLIFNAGDAAYRATNFDLAQALFEQATLSPDLTLQQKAYYNLGNAQFQSAKLTKDLDSLQAGLETAEKSFDHATTLNKTDADAAFNLAFTKNAIEQIKQFKEMMLRAKSNADDAVRRAEFHQALTIMAPLQKTIAAKQFEDYIKKLKEIDDIATPHQP